MTEILQPYHWRNFLKTGISTACLYPLETEKALELLLEEGFRHFEIFSIHSAKLSLRLSSG